MQPHKTSTRVVILIMLMLLGAYSLAESWWFGFALAAIGLTLVLQWQVTQLQQRLQQLEQHVELQLKRQSDQQLAPHFNSHNDSHLDLHIDKRFEPQRQEDAPDPEVAQQSQANPITQTVYAEAASANTSANKPAWMQRSDDALSTPDKAHTRPELKPNAAETSSSTAPDWWQKAQQWMLRGNPILRVAVVLLLVGVVLLLRFASEHWQLSLAAKLTMIAAAGAFATAAAYRLRRFNDLVAVAVQGVGLAVVFLSLIFAYQFQVLSSLWVSSAITALLLVITIGLSLKQSSLYLAILALGMAYVAPLLIPDAHPNALLIFAYYLLINVAVAVLNHLKGWKILNHIAFVASMVLAGAMIVDTEPKAQYLWLDVLLWLHIALFIYVSIRYSQLILQQQQQQQLRKLDNAALLDVGLIFAVPIVGFSLHAFLMQDAIWGLTLGAVALAAIYAGLVWWIRRRQPELALLSTSFLILSMVFVALIFPLAKGAHWSAIGWVVQGSALVVWGSAQRSRLSRYMGVALLLLSSISLFIQLWSDHTFPNLSTVIYTLAMFIAAGALLKYDSTEQRYFSASIFSALFLSLALYAGAWVSIEVLHLQNSGLSAYVAAATVLFGAFSLWMRLVAGLNWQHSHVALISLFTLMHSGEWLSLDVLAQGAWTTASAQSAFLLAGIVLAALLLFAQRMLHLGVVVQQMWAGLTVLAFASIGLALFPHWGLIPMAMVPVAYAALNWRSWQHNQLLQQPTVWVMALLWLLFNNLYLHNSTPLYALPILNPNDALNLLVLAGVLRFVFSTRMVNADAQLLLKITSLCMALLVLSFVLIRALHVYVDIPLQADALWQSGVVQLSLTVLWMLLALLLTSYASRKHNREFWYVGAALLGLVVTKLILLDLAQTGTITRVISFMAAGGFMLVIAYVAPLPPQREQSNATDATSEKSTDAPDQHHS